MGVARGLPHHDPDPGPPVTTGRQLLDPAVIERRRRAPSVLDENFGELTTPAQGGVENTLDHRRVDEQCQFVESSIEFIGCHAREQHTYQHDSLAKRAIYQRAGYVGQASSHSTCATNCTGPLSVACPR